jgi:hypothetical protein
MESEVSTPCQWRHCENDAAKHVVFGLRVFDSPDMAHISKTSPAEHLDLCAKHVEITALQYVHVTEIELGTCPQHGRP